MKLRTGRIVSEHGEETVKNKKNIIRKIAGMNRTAKIIASCLGVGLVLAGSVVVMNESEGYTVYYDGCAVGFVSEPQEVLENISNMNDVVSEEKDREAFMDENEFEFEKTVKPFENKNSWDEVAAEAADKCEINVNAYDVYVDGVFVAQDSSMDDIAAAIDRIKQEYIDAHPDENIDSIGFSQKVDINVTKQRSAGQTEAEEMYMVLNNLLTVKTTETIITEEIIPYDIVYSVSEDLEAGEVEVESEGSDGLLEKQTVIERVDGEQVSSSEVSSEVINEKTDQVMVVGVQGLLIGEEGMINPCVGVLTSPMGQRWGRLHRGIDIGAPMGTPVYASRAGVVARSEYNDHGYGNLITIDHGDGMTTYYAHLSARDAEVGDEVFAGQFIGLVGSTGNSTGPHLHFEVRIDGENVDPLGFVRY